MNPTTSGVGTGLSGAFLLFLLIPTAILILLILSIVKVVKGEMKTNHDDKTLWLIILVFIPVIGIILFWLLAADKKH